MPEQYRLLVIDDDILFLRAIVRILVSDFRVEGSTDARDVLARCTSGERFDVILCDLSLPGMTGAEFFESLELECPDQSDRVIFMTAAARDAGSRLFLDKVKNAVLDKPFTLADLCAVLVNRIAFAHAITSLSVR